MTRTTMSRRTGKRLDRTHVTVKPILFGFPGHENRGGVTPLLGGEGKLAGLLLNAPVHVALLQVTGLQKFPTCM